MVEGKPFVAATETMVTGRKQDKFRVNILVACSMAGERLHLLCIVTVKNPRWPVILGTNDSVPINIPALQKVEWPWFSLTKAVEF